MTPYNEYVLLTVLEKVRTDRIIREQRRRIRELTMLSSMLEDRLRESNPEAVRTLDET